MKGARIIALAGALLASPLCAQTIVSGVSGPLQDFSGTISTGGASQQAVGASPTGYRYYVACQNPTTATEPLYVNFGSAATTANSHSLAPGGSITFSNNFIPNGLVSVMAATTGHGYICKVGQ